MSTKPCGRPRSDWTTACAYPRMAGKQMCGWHWLLKQNADTQALYAGARRLRIEEDARRARVPKEEWPSGERWCAGCQSFVPLFYVSGSRCKSCASEAAHAQRVESVYGITKDEYAALFKLQGGKCYVCGRVARSKRLAVDHDHKSGDVRGLLCADVERGCNHAVLGNLEASAVDNGLAAARRLVAYLEDPPYARLSRGVTEPEDTGIAPRKPAGEFPVPLPVEPPF